jgi:hypothetical protein
LHQGEKTVAEKPNYSEILTATNAAEASLRDMRRNLQQAEAVNPVAAAAPEGQDVEDDIAAEERRVFEKGARRHLRESMEHLQGAYSAGPWPTEELRLAVSPGDMSWLRGAHACAGAAPRVVLSERTRAVLGRDAAARAAYDVSTDGGGRAPTVEALEAVIWALFESKNQMLTNFERLLADVVAPLRPPAASVPGDLAADLRAPSSLSEPAGGSYGAALAHAGETSPPPAAPEAKPWTDAAAGAPVEEVKPEASEPVAAETETKHE